VPLQACCQLSCTAPPPAEYPRQQLRAAMAPPALLLVLLLPAAAAAQAAANASVGCSLYAGCPWDKFPFKCSNPAPAVMYEQIKHYSPEVTCGNLFLESDIGGGINTEPIVLYSKVTTAQLAPEHLICWRAGIVIHPSAPFAALSATTNSRLAMHSILLQAEDDKFYTLVMVDPDATTLSFPEAPAPGSHAPVRHWIAGNIPGSGLKIGDFHAAT
jgi:hypothetical protein